MPDVVCWPPDDHARIIGRAIAGLLSGEDLAPWSDHVVRALLADRAFMREWRRGLDELPDPWRQMWAAHELALDRVIGFGGRPDATRRELRTWAGEAYTAAKRAPRRVASRHLRRTTDPPRPPFKPVTGDRSLLDGYRAGGRPREYCATARWLRAEVWADLRARALSSEGRPRRSQALAEILLADLERADPTRARSIQGRRLSVEGGASLRALVTAVNRRERDAKDLETVQSVCSIALHRYGPTPAEVAALGACAAAEPPVERWAG